MTELPVVTSALIACLVAIHSIGLSLVYPWLRPRLARLDPCLRANLLSFLAALPWLFTMVFVLMAFLPSVMTFSEWVQSHCFPHVMHPHICLCHSNFLSVREAGCILGLLAMAGLFCWVSLGRRINQGGRQIRLLIRLAEKAAGFNLVSSRSPLALSVGFFRPETLISTAVLEALSSTDLEVVLAHEKAHGERRDALRMLLAEILLVCVPRKIGILKDLALACEEACDRSAVPVAGSPAVVAAVMLRIHRLNVVTPVGHFGATGSQLAIRVKALLEDDYPVAPIWVWLIWLSPLLPLAFECGQHALEALL